MADPVNNPWGLSPRQVQIMHTMVTLGSGSAKETARLLGSSDRTVEVQVFRAIGKMDAKNRVHALLLWDRAQRPQPQGPAPGSVEPCAHCRGLGFVGGGA